MNAEQSNPLVTVAMVTYNSAPYVRTAIASVLNQSYRNFELIIGDDNSKDNTWEIVNSYGDARIRTYRNAQNLTQYPNRNRAMDLAQGKYIVYIDGDDVIYPHGLEFMVRMLEAFPECGMAVLSRYRSNLIFPVAISPHQFFTAEFFDKGFISTALTHVVFNTSVLKQVGGFPNRHISSDITVRYNIALRYPSLLINDHVTWWRETPGQQSSKVKHSMRGLLESIEQKRDILNDPLCPFTDCEKKEGFYNLNFNTFWIAARRLAKLNLKHFAQLWPYLSVQPRLLWRSPIRRNPFEGHTSANPVMVDFEKNPFSPGSRHRA
jgi:glycosyltransferase involved in cell wall biosynthesis